MKGKVFLFVLLIASLSLRSTIYSQSAVGMAYCAIKRANCYKEAKKSIEELDPKNPHYDFLVCMTYAHCDCKYWVCRCTGEGEGNIYSSEPGTLMACMTGCTAYYNGCEKYSPKKTRSKLQKLQIVAGEWKTSFGKMKLEQFGSAIFGVYEHDKGRLDGFIVENKIYGKWYEAPTYKPPKDAGIFELYFSHDGKSFSGKWKYGFSRGKWNGEWRGEKIQTR